MIMEHHKIKAFTLIELLVVISIIAILLSILMPSLHRSKLLAKAVVCQANLKHWGLVFQMYTDDNNGRFSNRRENDLYGYWPDSLRPYYDDIDRFRLCPITTKVATELGRPYPYAGGKLVAWGYANESWGVKGDYGSYGINSWVYDSDQDDIWDYPTEYNWRVINVSGANKIPLFMDSQTVEQWPTHLDKPPVKDDEPYRAEPVDNMKRVCINRHSGGVNYVFFDLSVRKVELKELWKLKWHRKFDVNGPYTIAGGVSYDDWPKWMKGFKEY